MPENANTSPGPDWGAESTGLVADALSLGGSILLRVHGESMLPALWPGDEVEIESCRLEDVECGEILLAQREGRLFLHRLVRRCRANRFVMTGDSMPGPDHEYSSEALLGRLVRRRQTGSALAISRRPGFGSTRFGAIWFRALGTLICHSGVARRIALRLHRHPGMGLRGLRNEAGSHLESL